MAEIVIHPANGGKSGQQGELIRRRQGGIGAVDLPRAAKLPVCEVDREERVMLANNGDSKLDAIRDAVAGHFHLQRKSVRVSTPASTFERTRWSSGVAGANAKPARPVERPATPPQQMTHPATTRNVHSTSDRASDHTDLRTPADRPARRHVCGTTRSARGPNHLAGHQGPPLPRATPRQAAAILPHHHAGSS